jgi:hypothetical protein
MCYPSPYPDCDQPRRLPRSSRWTNAGWIAVFHHDTIHPGHRQRNGREFLGLYLFNANGQLLEARIDDLGLDKPRARQLLKKD